MPRQSMPREAPESDPMLQLIGPTDTPEYDAARDLAERIGVAWADIATNPQHQMTIVAAAKCYGQPVCDIDMLVFYHTNTPYPLPAQPGDYRTVHVASLCLVIEVKEHLPEQVRFVGTQTEVQYHTRWHNVSEQNYKQRFAVKGFLEEQSIAPPFIISLIWLRNVPEAHIPNSLHNLIGQDTTWESILHRVRRHMRPKMHAAVRTLCISAGNELPRVVNLFSTTRKPQPTDIERTKLKAMTHLYTAAESGQVPAYVTNLGTQLLIIQGRGGTGKTATLLRLAHMLYEHRHARVLILTYNRALVADIRRLLALLGVRDGIAQQSIAVQTAHSYFYQLLRGFGILNPQRSDFLDNYDTYKQTLQRRLAACQQPCQIESLIEKNNTAFSWDFIFIDEAQDWPTDERDILYSIYDYHRFVIADGRDQLTRGYRRCEWAEHVHPSQRQIVTLRKSLRLKAGVCNVVNAVAEQGGLHDWVVDPFGTEQGRVVVLHGYYKQHRHLHNELVRDHTMQGRSPIDMLVCVPPRLVRRNRDKVGSMVAQTLHDWGMYTWDATNPQVTNTYPIDPEQVRIVQYDSCRGLEGWTVVHLGLDDLYDYKVNSFVPTHEDMATPSFDHARAAHDYAMRWLMIPLTRGIHTLVIQVSPLTPLTHPVVATLRAVAERFPNLVEWHSAESTVIPS